MASTYYQLTISNKDSHSSCGTSASTIADVVALQADMITYLRTVANWRRMVITVEHVCATCQGFKTVTTGKRTKKQTTCRACKGVGILDRSTADVALMNETTLCEITAQYGYQPVPA